MCRDDRGITLVEMIIAIAVTAIVLGAATLFIRNALKNYKLAENTIDLQIQAQVLTEQIAAWVMEGNYADTVEDGSGNDMFIIYHIPRKGPAAWDSDSMEKYMGKRWMRVIWCGEDGKLNMKKVEDSVPDPSDVNKSNIDNWLNDPSPLSEYVEGFKVTISKSSETTDGSGDDDIGDGLPYKVTVALSMKAGIQEYEFTDEINMRNAVYKAESSSEP